MARLIDADDLEDEIGKWGCNDYDRYDFIDAIEDAPTVDAIPRSQIDEMIKEIETDMSWDMYDENGNETDLHKRLMSIIHKYTDKEQNNDANEM